jgi:pimeloyl-ACP methyl ester carboxylesterase
MWSPNWTFDDATFARSAAAFDNEDFVEVVIHSYRHRTGSVPGDPNYIFLETQLAAQPAIDVPTIVLHGADDNVTPVGGSADHGRHFTASYTRRLLPGIGHNAPQEDPRAFAEAVIALCGKR